MSRDVANLIDEFMACLPLRDWPRMARTLSPDVRRSGVEDNNDIVVGRDKYLQWLSGFADKLFEYSWTTHRTIISGQTAVVDCSTRYLIDKTSKPFGYHLAMIFDVGKDGLIESVDLFWKTPAQRVPGDTIGSAD